MATYTREQFVKSVLMELRAVDPDEPVEPADYQRTNERVQQKFEQLYADGLMPFGLDGPIPARYMVPLTYAVAAVCTGLYPVGDRINEVKANGVEGMSNLWELREQFYSGQPAAAVYF